MSKKEKKLSKKEQRERDYRLICSLSSNKGRKLADPNAQAARDAQRKAQLEELLAKYNLTEEDVRRPKKDTNDVIFARVLRNRYGISVEELEEKFPPKSWREIERAEEADNTTDVLKHKYSSPKGGTEKELRGSNNVLASVLVCSHCHSPYFFDKQMGKDGMGRLSYQCKNHKKDCFNPSTRRLEKNLVEFLVWASLAIAIKIGDPIPLDASSVKGKENKTKLEMDFFTKTTTEELRMKTVIEANNALRRMMLAHILKDGCITVCPTKRKAEDIEFDVITMTFNNDISVKMETSPYRSKKNKDVLFNVYDDRVVEYNPSGSKKSTLLVKGVFHTDRTIEFTALGRLGMKEKEKPLDYYKSLEEELSRTAKECMDKAHDFDFKK